MSGHPGLRMRAVLMGAFATPLLLVAGAAGQEVRVAVEGGQLRDELGNAGTGAMIRPEILWRLPEATVRLGGLASVLAGQTTMGGVAAAEQRMAGAGPFDLRLAGDGSAVRAGGRSLFRARAGGTVGLEEEWVRLEAGPFVRWSAHRMDGSASPASGLFGFEPPRDGATSASANSMGMQVAGTARRGPVAGRIGWSGERMSASAGWSDWTAAVAVAEGPLSLAVEGGLRNGGLDERWGGVRIGLEVAAGIQLTGEVGTYPSDPLAGYRGGEVAMAGLALSQGEARRDPSVMRPAPLTDGRTRLVIRAPTGSRVELLGDWGRWTAQPVPEVEKGVFAVDVALPAGIHRFAFRVDGEWTVPPGYRLERDEYGGRRAIVEVGRESE